MFFLDYSGLSQQALGNRAGIDQKTISDYKLGLVMPSDKALRRLARAAGVPWAESRRACTCRGAPATALQGRA
jgi:transcriptional regulator with XRE-family HTH domain